MRNLFRCLVSILMILAALPVLGAASARTERVTVTLLSEQTAVTPGQTLWLGLRFEIIPHWHIYWRNPGDSGAAPTIDWTLPDGWSAGELHWPVPIRIPVGPLTNYGYEDSVTLLTPITTGVLPENAHEARIAAHVSWLVCRVDCIPEEAELELVLPIAATPAPLAADTARQFEDVRARWPVALPVPATYQVQDNRIVLDLPGLDWPGERVHDLWFAANDWGPVAPNGIQQWRCTPEGIRLTIPVGDLPPDSSMALSGLLVLEEAAAENPVTRGFTIAARPLAGGSVSGSLTLGVALVFALLGGLILNLMPCVLPVLSFKVLGFVQEAGSERRRLAAHGLLYAAGAVLSFAALAGALLALRAGGESLGWGFQLQSPVVVTLLAYLMLSVGLNFSGVFSVGHRLMGTGQNLASRTGPLGALLTGVLAAVVASPCTAPFMGAALGYAVTRPPVEALAVFLTLGIGFTLPVLMLSLWPAWTRLLPKPGPWMPRLQQFLAFPMYGAVAWLVWVLSQQTSPQGFAAGLAGLVAVALSAWLYGQWRGGWRLSAMAAALIGAVALGLAPLTQQGQPATRSTGAEAWSPERVASLRAEGRPVLVNFTAAWCITCQVNEQVALSTPTVAAALASKNIAYLKGDWTRRDPLITRELERHGRSGVPLYLLYPPRDGAPRVLPPLLTERLVLNALNQL